MIYWIVSVFVILWAIGAIMSIWESTKKALPPAQEADPRLIVTNPDGSKTELQLLYSGRNIDELV
jgi:hypothetical protein